MLHKIIATYLDLPDQTFAHGDIVIRLQIPAANDAPLSNLYPLLDLLKQLRSIFFYIFICRYLVMAKYVIVFACQPGSGAEGWQYCAGTFLPFPLPNGVDVGIADQMYPLFFIIIPLMQMFSYYVPASLCIVMETSDIFAWTNGWSARCRRNRNHWQWRSGDYSYASA